jgi:hypothetical protein
MKNTPLWSWSSCNSPACRLSFSVQIFPSLLYRFPPFSHSMTQSRDYTVRLNKKQVFSSSNPIFTWAPDLGQFTHGYNPNFHYGNKLETAALKFALEISWGMCACLQKTRKDTEPSSRVSKQWDGVGYWFLSAMQRNKKGLNHVFPNCSIT